VNLEIKFDDSYILLNKSDVVYVFTSHDTDPSAQSFYYTISGESSRVISFLYEYNTGFSVEELSTKLNTTNVKIFSVIKSLIEMRIISLPSNFPKNVKSDYSEIEKIVVEPQDFSVAASDDNNYKDIYDPFIRLS
jgi:hypothetical protein